MSFSPRELFGYLRHFHLFLLLPLIFSFAFANQVKSAELAEIEARGNLIVGVKDNLRPLAYQDIEGNLKGFEIDLAKRIAQEILGDEMAIKLVPVANQNRLEVVIKDQVDLVIASVSLNSSRQRIVNFSDYYFLSGTAIIVKQSTVNVNLDNSTLKIGVLQNSRSIDQLKYFAPQLQLIAVTSYQQAFDLIEQGEIQGFAGDITVLTGWQQEYSTVYKILPKIWGGYPLAVVLPKGRQYQPLRDKVNQIIKQLKQEGWLDQKAQQWGLRRIEN